MARGVTFSSADANIKWGGIRLNHYSDDASSILDSCIIEYATDGIYCQSSNPTLTNNIIRNNIDGIEADTESGPIVIGNQFTMNQVPLKIYGNEIDGNLFDNIYEENRLITESNGVYDTTNTDYIYVTGANGGGTWEHLWENKTYHWFKDGAPYRLTDHLHIFYQNNNGYTSKLKIYPQTEIALESGKYIHVGSTDSDSWGALEADSVTFTSVNEDETWIEIKMRSQSRDEMTFLNNCIIEYADNGVYCESSNPTLTNNIFRYNTDGVDSDAGAIPKILNNTFLENVRPISVHAQRIDSTLYGNSYIDNDKNYIEVQGDYIDENGTFVWAMDGAPYMVNGDIYVRRTNNVNHISILKIEPGTEVWFGSGSDLFIGHESNGSYRGALQAESVTFTRSQGIETWPGIDIRNYSVDDYTYLNNCIVEYATDGIYCQSSNPTLTNNIIRNNIDGIEADTESGPIVIGNQFTMNQVPLKIYGMRLMGTCLIIYMKKIG